MLFSRGCPAVGEVGGTRWRADCNQHAHPHLPKLRRETADVQRYASWQHGHLRVANQESQRAYSTPLAAWQRSTAAPSSASTQLPRAAHVRGRTQPSRHSSLSPPLAACSTAGPSSARHQTGRMHHHPACGTQRCMTGRAAVATVALGRQDMLGRQDVAQQEGSRPDAPENKLYLP